MNRDKSTVSTLHEFCAKQKLPLPTFDVSSGSNPEFGFECTCEVNGVMAHATGRSKRDAKHFAAANLITKLAKLNQIDMESIPSTSKYANDIEMSISNVDMVGALRDYCVQHNHPLPYFDMVQQGGTPDTPEFIISCMVASIKRYGVSDKKKDARQKAAFEILNIIRDSTPPENEMQIGTVDAKIEQTEEERYLKFKTYRELMDSKTGEMRSTLLTDRHYFFTKFHDHLKTKAMNIIKSDAYESDKTTALQLLDALKINPTIKSLRCATTAEEMFFVDLNTEYDVVFAASENAVYKDIIAYFREMLY